MNECVEAEREVVACYIRFQGEGCPAYLTPEYITDAKLRVIFEAAIAVMKRDRFVSGTLVAEHLQASGLLGDDMVPGPYLVDLLGSVGTAVGVPHYAARIVNAHNLRVLAASMAAAATEIRGAREWQDALDAAKKALVLAEARMVLNGEADMVSASTLLTGVMAKLMEIQAGRVPPALSTGWPSLDAMLSGGLRPGQLVIGGGRPAMGKSSFGTCLAMNVAVGGGEVLYYPFEESQEDVAHRWLSASSPIPLGWLKDPKDRGRNPQLMDAMSAASPWMERIRIPRLTRSLQVGALAASARRCHAQKPVSLVVVDYIQRMKATNTRDPRYLQVKEDAIGLHDLAHELGCPVVALAQFGRSAEEGTDKRPSLKDFREAGDIENEGTPIFGFYRDEYYNKQTPEPGVVEVLVLKNRFGPTGTVKLGWHGSRVAFYEMEGGR